MLDQAICQQLTLADVIERLNARRDICTTKRRDLVSAITRTARLLDLSPKDLPANAPELRARLLTIHSTPHGLNKRSWANVKSSLARALKEIGIIGGDKAVPRTKAWNTLLSETPEDHHGYQLARLARFCSARGIEPTEVSDDTIAEYYRHLDETLLSREPFKPVKDTVDAWNRVRREVRPDLPALKPIRKGRYVARPLTDYPETVQTEIAGYLKRLSIEEIFDEGGPTKALRPTSLRNVEAHLRQYLDALVTSGRPLCSIRDLRSALELDAIRDACRVMAERHGGKVPTGLPNILATLLAIGRHHLQQPRDWIEAVMRLRARIEKELGASEMAMRPKSVERLAQFDDPRNVAAIVSLPELLIRRARQDPEGRYSALDAMRAAAISILLSCPMRAANLAALDLKRHLRQWRGGRHPLYSVRIEGVEVKNGTPIEADFGVEVSRILQTYIQQFRPKLTEAPSTALFPQRTTGAPRRPGTLSQDLSAAILRETGLMVHAHLFRHLAAKLFLDASPGEYETVRRILGHKKRETTVQFYSRLTSKKAVERYEDVVLAPMRGKGDG